MAINQSNKQVDLMKLPQVIVLNQLIRETKLMRKNLNAAAAEFAARKEREMEEELNQIIESAAA
jgi:F0F1-type ATP synthase membrane subunit b/b'